MTNEAGMFVEFNWTANVYQFRFGHTFIEVGGFRSAEDLESVRWILATCKLKLGKKTDTRTWAVEAITGEPTHAHS